jgi:hypothetical protein
MQSPSPQQPRATTSQQPRATTPQQPQAATPQQPQAAIPQNETSKAVKDVSILAISTITVIIIVIIVSVSLLSRLLNGIIDSAGKIAPTFECTAWLTRRQQSYLDSGALPTNPATGEPYTVCEATAQAVNDAQAPASGSACPTKRAPPDISQQAPYIYYMASQGCSGV